MRIRYCVLFASLLSIVISTSPCNAQNKNPFVRMDRSQVDNIKSVVQKYDIGFPFNETTRFGNMFTYEIGKQILSLEESGIISSEKRGVFLNQVLNVEYEKVKSGKSKGYLTGSLNYGAFVDRYPEINAPLLFASMVLLSKTGEIEQIEPFLALSRIYFGSMTEVYENPPAGFGLQPITNDNNLTKVQRLSFFPAAKAILTNPEKTKPLLISMIKDVNANLLLRLRAAAFLNEMDQAALGKVVAEGLEEEIAAEVLCIMERNVSWRDVYKDHCKDDIEGKKFMERIRNRK